MNQIARQCLVAIGVAFCLGLLLKILFAAPSTPVPFPRQESESPSLPWEPFRHPGDDLKEIATVLEGQPASTQEKLDRLDGFSADHQSSRVRGLADFARGLVLLEARRAGEAAESFLSPRIDSTELSSHALYFASGEIDDADRRQAIDILDRLIRKDPEFALVNEARLRRGRLLVEEQRLEEAAGLFRDILADGQPDFIDEGLYELAGSSTRFGLVDLLAAFALFDDDPALINRIEAGFRAVTPAMVSAAARRYLREDNRSVLIVEPGRTAAEIEP